MKPAGIAVVDWVVVRVGVRLAGDVFERVAGEELRIGGVVVAGSKVVETSDRRGLVTNSYTYADSDPTTEADPSGLTPNPCAGVGVNHYSKSGQPLCGNPHINFSCVLDAVGIGGFGLGAIASDGLLAALATALGGSSVVSAARDC